MIKKLLVIALSIFLSTSLIHIEAKDVGVKKIEGLTSYITVDGNYDAASAFEAVKDMDFWKNGNDHTACIYHNDFDSVSAIKKDGSGYEDIVLEYTQNYLLTEVYACYVLGDYTKEKVPYIDENGTTKYCTDYKVAKYTPDSPQTFDCMDGWYVIYGYNMSGKINIDGDVKIIILDGVNCDFNFIVNSPSKLTIYGQKCGSACLRGLITAEYGEKVGDIVINGCRIENTGGNSKIAVIGSEVDGEVSNITIRNSYVEIYNDYAIGAGENGTMSGDLTIINSYVYAEGQVGAPNMISGNQKIVINSGEIKINGTTKTNPSKSDIVNSNTLEIKNNQKIAIDLNGGSWKNQQSAINEVYLQDKINIMQLAGSVCSNIQPDENGNIFLGFAVNDGVDIDNWAIYRGCTLKAIYKKPVKTNENSIAYCENDTLVNTNCLSSLVVTENNECFILLVTFDYKDTKTFNAIYNNGRITSEFRIDDIGTRKGITFGYVVDLATDKNNKDFIEGGISSNKYTLSHSDGSTHEYDIAWFEKDGKTIKANVAIDFKYDKQSGTYTLTNTSNVAAGDYYYRLHSNEVYSKLLKVSVVKAGALEITKPETTNKTYDGKALSAKVTTNVVKNTTVTYSTDGVNYSNTIPSISDVGQLKVYVKAVNNDFTTATTDFTLTISPCQLTVSGSSVAGKTYDSKNTAEVTLGTVDGIVSGDDVKVSVSGTFDDANVGKDKDVEITYSLSGEDAKNYSAPISSSSKATISAKSIKVQAVNKTIAYGQTLPTLSYNHDPLYGDDSFSGQLQVNNYNGEVGKYDIVVGTLSLSTNYTIDYTKATLTVDKASQNQVDVNDLTTSDETIMDKADGSISGVDDTMEYKLASDATYTSVSANATKIENLAAGTYQIRFKATSTHEASEPIEVTINPSTNTLTVHFDLQGGVGNIDDQYVGYNGSVIQPSVTPQKEGYIFSNFSLNKDSLPGIEPLPYYMPFVTGDITAYAIYKQNPLIDESKSNVDVDETIKSRMSTTFTKDKDGNIVIDIEDNFALYGEDGVVINDVDEQENLTKDDDYTVEEGSIKITLKKEYLDGLKTGKHNYEIVISQIDGPSYTYTLVINVVNVPKTGIDTSVFMYTSLISLLGIAYIIYRKKKLN